MNKKAKESKDAATAIKIVAIVAIVVGVVLLVAAAYVWGLVESAEAMGTTVDPTPVLASIAAMVGSGIAFLIIGISLLWLIGKVTKVLQDTETDETVE